MSIFLLNNPRCVHIHIPKTGGSSIRIGVWLKDYTGPKFGEFPEEWEKYFKFAFVRHPFDRFVSAYYDFVQYRGFPGSIEQFAKIAGNPDIPHVVVAGGCTQENICHHTVPQTDPSLFLDKADFVGRYENYDADLSHILKTVGIAPQSVPRLRRTERPDWAEALSFELREQLWTLYSEDFVKLGYSDG